jgi:3',5'-cyclic AMP phosphodiesterase CpdA
MIPLIIHHLSDLHVGASHYRASRVPFLEDRKDGWLHLAYYLTFLSKAERKPHVVIVSGDFSSHATEVEINRANDFLRAVAGILEKAHGVSVPRICVVPGNHDLDWGQENHQAKVDRFRRLSQSLETKVVSPYTENPSGPYVSYRDLNLLVYTLDSCALGGIDNPLIEELASKFQVLAKAIANERDRDAYGEALSELEELSRQDPGFVDPKELERMDKLLPKGHEDMFKIAVTHHNPSNLPSADRNKYDSIINGGQLKKKLLDLGFDILLHGHRHFRHCSYEEYLEDLGRGAKPSDERLPYRQGLYVISGGTLGMTADGGWFEIEIDDTPNVHRQKPPSSLVQIRVARTNQGLESYDLDDSPIYRFTVDKPVYASLRLIQEALSRKPVRHDCQLKQAVERILAPTLELRSELDDWQATGWQDTFHKDIHLYAQVFGTDILGPQAWLNAQYLRYLTLQFQERVRRGGFAALDQPLAFSEPVLTAIRRTDWKPIRGSVRNEPLEPSLDQLEVVRVLLWSLAERMDRDVLWLVEQLHQLFGIPVFLLSPDELASHAQGDPDRAKIDEEFVIGLDAHGPRRTYLYRIGHATRDVAGDEAEEVKERFLGYLKNPKLRTIQSLLSEAKGARRSQRVTTARRGKKTTTAKKPRRGKKTTTAKKPRRGKK